MMIRLNNKGQSLVMFICLLPILLLIVLAIVDVSRMVIEKNKLNNINYIAISYYSSHKEDDDVTERIISLVKRNDEDIINVRINKDKNTIYLDKKIDSTMGKIIGISEYEIVSEYSFADDGIKRVK
ncbi:MAG: TadE/TadG family type IV pilus assembly protein [Bacilli bacterium]